jgi:hypothetical protein
MNAGDKATIPFGKGTMEGTVVRICEKTVWVKVDFPKHPGKLVRRKLTDLEKVSAKTAKKRVRKPSK